MLERRDSPQGILEVEPGGFPVALREIVELAVRGLPLQYLPGAVTGRDTAGTLP